MFTASHHRSNGTPVRAVRQPYRSTRTVGRQAGTLRGDRQHQPEDYQVLCEARELPSFICVSVSTGQAARKLPWYVAASVQSRRKCRLGNRQIALLSSCGICE